jgi:hypothetical protein
MNNYKKIITIYFKSKIFMNIIFFNLFLLCPEKKYNY